MADVNTSSIIGEDEEPIREKAECVLSISASENDENERLQMGSCESDDAWSWSINEGGVLTWERNLSSIRAEQRNEFGVGMIFGGSLSRLLDVTSGDHIGKLADTEIAREEEARCLWKTADASAITAACLPSEDYTTSKRSLVSFSMIQYQNSAAVSPQLPRFPRNQQHSKEAPSIESEKQQLDTNIETKTIDTDFIGTASHLPTMKRSSQNNAAIHDPQNGISRTPGPHLNTARQSSKKENVRIHEIRSPLGVGGYFERTIQPESHGSKLLHHPPSPVASPVHDEILHRPRKIPVHPYIEASNNGYYTDEITGMSYPTDISEYLGHDRKEIGRHTLTGVGIFTKTMLKIKVRNSLALLLLSILQFFTPSLSDCTLSLL